MSLAVLTGLRRLPPEHAEFVYGSQLRASDRLLGLGAVLTATSVFLVDFRFIELISGWLLALWTVLTIAAYAPSFRLRHEHAASDYATVTHGGLIGHGVLSLLQGGVWVAAMILMSGTGYSGDIIMLWTIGCCLMAAVAIAFQSTPLAACNFILTVGGGAIWMMWQHADPLLIAVVTTYAMLLIGASLRQAHLFGVQLTTNKMLAEKREVVSLLLKEHDVETADWLWQTDMSRRLTGVSPVFARVFGLDCEDLEGRPVLEVLAGPAWEDGKFDPALHTFADKLKQRGAFSDIVLPVIVQGERRWWKLSASPRMDEKGSFLGFRGVGSDITAEKESSERIALMARHDMLTGLPNRLHLTEELTAVLDNTKCWNMRCAILMIDLDRFKTINDTLGHPIGDKLLALVADRLRKICSANEICGRLGGDEFAVIVRDLPDMAYADRLAAAIIDAASQPFTVDHHTLFIGASVGSAAAPQDGEDAEMLIRNADLAMYRAKDAGRNKHFRYVHAMHADAEERRNLEISLRDALARQEFHLLYQPIVDGRAGTVCGFEALLRWNHPELGVMQPARFITIAEEARMIAPIGNWVLRAACEEAMKWPSDIRLSVNISAGQLYDPDFLEAVVSALAHSRLPAERLELEVTESVFLHEGTAGGGHLLDKLMALGIRLSLDDFGTGYSSLSYLSRTRFSTIKIDRNFVNGAARNQRESLAIIRAVVAMAHSLGMETTAEGVETEGEYDLVRALGCTRIQGYYFGRPMRADEARTLFGDSGVQVA